MAGTARATRFAPDWGSVARGAAVGGAATVGVGLAALGGGWAVDALFGARVVGANIGVGIGVLAVRLVATPLVGWGLLRAWGVPRAGAAALFGTAAYLLLALPGWTDPAPPGVVAAWLVLGALAGAVGAYAGGCTAPARPRA
ncbi:hypothetical protein ACFPZ0_18380 [Streptomonospora nanhaiensis]|uniref:Uncharacterized protein n=1 Tax=Streptomonospora nanhaiensis TaxID=1323731 RepID=A0A853BEE9_9ACTN|nr:hypothetical protein [Streptomonospora nanhaiensis]MBV2366270.1 hypothetical protein [Streptomonospora nanhaiensis]MBX9390350.1 hypothetical protein [Streptomonospora nanhaiensis]NYI93808.1 hypothetical protein [Streptomonospora nanhaiensis]